jgi:hypothetical protein
MSDVSFTPTFRHTDYVDNRDRVQAGGPNGFNARFRALEDDLGTVSDVITEVAGALKKRPPTEKLIDQTVTIPPFVTGPPSSGGTFDVQLGGLLPLTSHAFHLVSVRPGPAFLNAQVTWEEIAFAADTGPGGPLIARMLRVKHQRPIAVTVLVRVLRLELPD